MSFSLEDTGRRIVRPFLVESVLLIGLLYLLGEITIRLAPTISTRVDMLSLGIGAAPLALSMTVVRRARHRFPGGLGQEITLVTALTFLLAGACGVSFFLLNADHGGRLSAIVMLEAALAVPILAGLWRWLVVRYRLPGFSPERLVLLGTGRLADEVRIYLERHRELDYEIVATLSAEPDRSSASTERRQGVRIAGQEVLRSDGIDRVIVALEERRGRLPVRDLVDLRLSGIRVEEATAFLERASGRLHVESLRPSFLIFSGGFRLSPLRALLKRSADIFLSAVLLVLTLPIMALSAILIRLETPGPVFYRQQRVGKDGKPFMIVKFRSMVADAESRSGPTWCTEDDPRITRVGRLIRKLRIDELPQIFNVLRGDMSFVGPRPERPYFVQQLTEEIPFYGLRASVRPGVTGWAQVRYRYGASAEDALEKLKYDLFYIKNAGLLLDLWIVMETIRVVLLGAGAR